MGKVIFGMTISLDGFVNDKEGKVGRLYADFEALHDTEILQESIKMTGAVVMGRRSYEMAQGDFTGYEYQVPIFVLTHTAPEKGPRGQNENLRVSFVTEGLESALAQAKAAAGDKDITVIGGPNTGQQLIRQGLLDELAVSIVPVLLGEGLRLFEHLESQSIELEKIKLSESPGRTDLIFRIVRGQ